MRRHLLLPVAAAVATVFAVAVGIQGPVPERAGTTPGGARGADPVDLNTGLYMRKSVDLVVPDIVPVVFSRHYLSGDNRMSRAFGIGTTHSYDTFLVGDTMVGRLITEEGGSIYYRRTNPGTSLEALVLEHRETPTQFFGSTLTWNDGRWRITLTNGAMHSFLPCFRLTKPPHCALIGLRDQSGNTTTLTRNADQALVKIESPNGRWVRLAHDPSNRVVRAWGSTGKSVDYEYDAEGRLAAAKASTGMVQTYRYDAQHRLITIREGDGTEIVNDYDTRGRVMKQVITYQPSSPGEPAPAPDVYEVDYFESGGHVVATELLKPGGVRRRVVFQVNGYAIEDTRTRPDGSGVTMFYTRDPATTVVSHVRVVCREADGRETVLQAAVGQGVKADSVAQTLSGQCRIPFLLDTEPEQP